MQTEDIFAEFVLTCPEGSSGLGQNPGDHLAYSIEVSSKKVIP